MALYIVTEGQQEKVFHVPFKRFDDNLIYSVSHIQADGDELEHIKYVFTMKDKNQFKSGYSVPMPREERVVRWYGDIAKTILANL